MGNGKGNVNNVIILGNINTFKHSLSLGTINSQKEYHKKDLKLLRRQLNIVRNDISLYKNEFFYIKKINSYVFLEHLFMKKII